MRRLALLTVALLALSTLAAPAAAAGPTADAAGPTADAAGRPVGTIDGRYPRLIRLAHSGAANGTLVASVNNYRAGVHGSDIFHSNDGGLTFTLVGQVRDDTGRAGSCCAALYELPVPIGANPAGTLLWAASTGGPIATPDRRMRQRLWRSTDQGRTWSFLSTIATALDSSGGWEPEFTIAADGRLVVVYSDEADPAHSQKLVALRSDDGISWTGRHDVVALGDKVKRPGMASIRTLADGRYLMAYEICESGRDTCEIHVRYSTDGWNWGDPNALVPTVKTADSRYPAHTPTLAVDGNTVLLAYQRLRNNDGSPAPGDGRTILANTAGGAGPWYEIAAPITVTDFSNPCANYSSPLLPTPDGKAVLQIATQPGDCRAAAAAAPIVPTGGTSAPEGGQTFVTGDRPHHFDRTPTGDLRHRWVTGTGAVARDTWGAGLAGAPVTTLYDGGQHAFGRSTSATLEHWWWTPTEGFQQETIAGDIASDPAALVIDGKQHVWAVDRSGALLHWWWQPTTARQRDTWGTGVTGRPSVMLVGGVQHAFARTAAGRVRHWWWDRHRGMRSETIADGLVGDPVAAQIGDAQHLWGVDAAGRLRHWWWGADHGWRTDVWNAAGPAVTGRPAVLLTGAQQHIFARSTTGVLEHWRWSAAGGLVQEHWGTGVTVSNGPSAVEIDGVQQVYATTAEGVLHRWTWSAANGLGHDPWGL